MATPSVQLSIRIRAKPGLVWNTLTDATKIAQWMGGTHVESTWEPGSAISFTGTLHGHPQNDRGTVLACDSERLLRYNHWSALSRRDDSEKARTIITLTLTLEGDETELEVCHDNNITGNAALGHARFFWRNALNAGSDGAALHFGPCVRRRAHETAEHLLDVFRLRKDRR